ncbi:MAG: hypothetical protein SGBAC_001924 [Bacillariaceae sp.]
MNDDGSKLSNALIENQEQEQECFAQHQYRVPSHHEGLPQLIEVFYTTAAASSNNDIDDVSSAKNNKIWFAAFNPGVCEPEWRRKNSSIPSFFHKQEQKNKHDEDIIYHCEFPDGTVVESDPVPPAKPNDFWTTAILMISCRIPDKLMMTARGTPRTTKETLTVSLHATVDLETPVERQREEQEHEEAMVNWRYSSADKLGVYRDLKVCSREWPDLTLATTNHHGSRDSNKKALHDGMSDKRRTLSMVTQIRMEYETFEYSDRTRIATPPENIVTWIEYHLLIGFEHFYIFDNDPKSHGPLELLLEPYVEAGIVTYVWYPMQDCFRKSDDELDGSRITISQAFSSTTALRRYAHMTEFMGHFDIDEYLQLPPDVMDVKHILKEMPSDKSTLFAPQKWYHNCDQTRRLANTRSGSSAVLQRSSSLFPLTQTLCVSPDSTPGKSIMRANDILGFFVHAPWVKTNHELFEDWNKEVETREELFVAHARKRRARDGIPIVNEGEPRPLVSSPALEKRLEKNVEERMVKFRNVHHN